MKKWFYSLSLLLIGCASVPLFAQKIATPAQRVADLSAAGVQFEQLTYEPFLATGVFDAQAARFARGAQFLMLHYTELQQIMRQRPQAMRLRVPYRGTTVEIDLVRVQILTPDFKLETSTSNGVAVPFEEGLHYQGVLAGDATSLAAFSFFDTEIMGFIADRRQGNRVLGRLDLKGNTSKYIFYDDSQLVEKMYAPCGVIDDKNAELILDNTGAPEVQGCVRIYFETDHALFLNKGSVQNTINYVTGAFNQMAILFNNEQISVQLSQVFCWVTPDFYSTTNSQTALEQFKAFRTSFNADLAHLVVIGGQNTGGIAYLSAICTNYKYAYSDIHTTYNNVPTYSWTVMVLTHETGHNMSSRHTHWCGWTGGALDNCYTPEGNCQPGPPPINGGTIMSYCHLTTNGINLANGFGQQPGDAIRNFVSTRTCLAANCTPFPTCNPPLDLSVSNITSNSAQISWGAVTGATSYTLTYRPVGNGAWTTVNNATSPTTITNLPADDEIEVTIRSNCGSANSDYRTGIIFKTAVAPVCAAPANLSMINITSNSATATWSAVSGATSYKISWKLSTATSWGTAVTVTTTNHTITGLSASTAYNVRVRAVCGSTNSAYATVNFSTLAPPACAAPTNLSATATSSTSANVSWSAVSGASNYRLSWKLSTATSWGAEVTVTGTSYSITGLTASTTYNVRVRTACSNGIFSDYVETTFTTQSSNSCTAPTNFTCEPTSPTQALAAWTSVPGATSYQISRKLTTANGWSGTTSTSLSSIVLSGLQPGATYDVRVRAKCNTVWSAYSYTQVSMPNNTQNTLTDDRTTPDPTDYALLQSTQIYPNPTDGRAVLTLDLPAPENVQILTFDAYGRLCQQQKSTVDVGMFQIDVAALPAGVYFVHVVTENSGRAVRRLVKN